MEASGGGSGLPRPPDVGAQTGRGSRVLDVLRYASFVQLPERWGKPPEPPRRVPLPRVRIAATRARVPQSVLAFL